MFLYLTYWFPRGYLARYTAYFMIANPLSFVIGGPLASLILGMGGTGGLRGWQWIFLIEGIPAFLLAFVVLKFLADGPARAAWLTSEEKVAVAARLAIEEPAGRPDLWPALRDPRVLALGIAYFMFNVSSYGVYLWLPQIVRAMGFSNTATGFIVALCFVASTPAMILCGRSSSRRGERIWHVGLSWLLAGASLATASLVQSNAIILAAFAIGLAAQYAPFGAFFSLPSSFLRGTAVAGGIGLIGTFGNIGAFLGPVLIGVLVQGSGNYRTGFAADGIGYALAALIVIAVGRMLAPRAIIVQPAI
jgi:ACS family tartrate transporter-like MFS transporter